MFLMVLFRTLHLQGQTESKKRSRSVETKGTAMSFGFKKKLLPTHKKNASTADAKLKENSKNDLTTQSNSSILKVDNACCVGDNNGNSGELKNYVLFYDDFV